MRVLIGIVVAITLAGCTPKEKADGRAASSAATATTPTPMASPMPAAQTAKLALTCPAATTWKAFRDAKPGLDIGGWSKRECGAVEMSWKYSPATGTRSDKLVGIERFPRKGRRAATVFKEAIDAVMPNLGAPKMSVGGCALDPKVKAALSSLGGDALQKADDALHAQGGWRGAVFGADGSVITVLLSDTDKQAPDSAVLKWTDEDVDVSAWSAIAWDDSAPCK